MEQKFFEKLLDKGLPKLVEQGFFITFLVIGSVILFQLNSKSNDDLIKYLREDNTKMIEKITAFTNEMRESNRINRELIEIIKKKE